MKARNFASMSLPLFLAGLASLAALYLGTRYHINAFLSGASPHLVAAAVFGVITAAKVLVSPTGSSWFLMPLVLAPLEYLMTFFWPMLATIGILMVWQRLRPDHSKCSKGPLPTEVPALFNIADDCGKP